MHPFQETTNTKGLTSTEERGVRSEKRELPPLEGTGLAMCPKQVPWGRWRLGAERNPSNQRPLKMPSKLSTAPQPPLPPSSTFLFFPTEVSGERRGEKAWDRSQSWHPRIPREGVERHKLTN